MLVYTSGLFVSGIIGLVCFLGNGGSESKSEGKTEVETIRREPVKTNDESISDAAEAGHARRPPGESVEITHGTYAEAYSSLGLVLHLGAVSCCAVVVDDLSESAEVPLLHWRRFHGCLYGMVESDDGSGVVTEPWSQSPLEIRWTNAQEGRMGACVVRSLVPATLSGHVVGPIGTETQEVVVSACGREEQVGSDGVFYLNVPAGDCEVSGGYFHAGGRVDGPPIHLHLEEGGFYEGLELELPSATGGQVQVVVPFADLAEEKRRELSGFIEKRRQERIEWLVGLDSVLKDGSVSDPVEGLLLDWQDQAFLELEKMDSDLLRSR